MRNVSRKARLEQHIERRKKILKAFCMKYNMTICSTGLNLIARAQCISWRDYDRARTQEENMGMDTQGYRKWVNKYVTERQKHLRYREDGFQVVAIIPGILNYRMPWPFKTLPKTLKDFK